jgi:invasion protein IalB
MMMTRGIYPLIILSLALAAGQARAEDPQKIGVFKDWEAYSYMAEDSKVCFAFSKPKTSKSSKKADRGEIRLIVTNYPGRQVKGQISTVLGYAAKSDSQGKLKVDDKVFALFAKDGSVWSAAEDAAIVAAMKTGKALELTATSKKDTETTDSYSLAGIAAAMEAIDKACK